jgi:ABC-type antimicrobial peptide transport system permease subunit
VEDDSIVGYLPQDLVIRGGSDPMGLAPAVRAAVRAADPQQPVSNLRPLGDIVAGETVPRRVQVRVLATFAAAALGLAAVGLHGLLAFAVSSRRQEIGVRIALGARTRHILAMVLRDAFAMAGVGVGLGLLLAQGAGHAMAALLAGVPPGDGVTLAAAIGLSVLVTLAGTLVPARRAVVTDPLVAMRAE